MKSHSNYFLRKLKAVTVFSFLLIWSMVFGGNLSAQISVTGRVTDSRNGEPLIGATVMLKTVKQGTSTDVNGSYVLSVPDVHTVLVFSFIGYKSQEVVVGQKKKIDVALVEDAELMDEVVVVGYGIQKRESVTGSVSQIGSKEIMQAPVANLSSVIGGRIAGVVTRQSSGLPGSDDATMLVRGMNTTGVSSPVIIVDGVQRSFNQLDPSEIETISILKDASAAAVYGLQGANGVILVTTKRGQLEKAKVTYSGSVSWDVNTRFPEFLSGPEYAYWYNKGRVLDGLDPVFTKSDVDKMMNGDPEGKLGNTNWVDKLFGTGFTHHHNLTVSGGKENIKYFVSAGYLSQEGSIKRFDFERYNLRSNIDAVVAKNLTITFDLAGRLEKRSQPSIGAGKGDYNNIITQVIRTHPYLPETYNGLPTAVMCADNIQSPLAARDQSGFSRSQMAVFQSNVSIKWDIPWVKGLNVKVMGSYDHDYTWSKSFITPYKVAQADLSNKSTEGIRYTEVQGMQTVEATLTEGMARASRVTLQPSINYANTFGKHDVAALLLYEQSEYRINNMSGSLYGFDYTQLPELSQGKYPNGSKPISGGSSVAPRAGFVARLNYAYDNRYLIELSGRYDGSYKFRGEGKKRWAFFPAASIGWRISNEEFFKNSVSFMENLKLRASIGKLGNDDVAAYSYYRTSSWVGSSPCIVIGGVQQNGLYTNGVAAPNITWSQTLTYNVGFESSMWNGLLGIEFDWFYQKTTDILKTQSTYPPSVGGYYPAYYNGGKVDNRGFEIILKHDNHIGAFNYGARLNLNWARNKILDIDESANIPDWQKQNGRRIGEKKGYVALGLFKTDEEAALAATVKPGAQAGDVHYLDINGDGKITKEQDVTFIGKSSIPELMGGLNVYASWKGLDFSILFQGAAICDVALMGYYDGGTRDDTEFTRTFYNGGNTPRYLVKNSWSDTNPNGKYPRLTTTWRGNNNSPSTIWLFDGSYLRLKNVQIGYTLPKYLTKYIGAEQLRIYFAGTNLATWSNFKYLDPEAPDVSNGYYPQQKSYTVGINLTF